MPHAFRVNEKAVLQAAEDFISSGRSLHQVAEVACPCCDIGANIFVRDYSIDLFLEISERTDPSHNFFNY